MPFELHHHATMLEDRIRLSAFREAIEETVKPTDCVVDVGTGTGILASYAASITQGTVYGVEYFPEAAQLAQCLMEYAAYGNVKIINDSSYNCTLEIPPDLLVTETIGPLGPEENIVELTYAFCRRFPSVRQVIPLRLRLLAVPIYSEFVDALYERFLRAYKNTSHGQFDYHCIFNALDYHAGTHFFQGDLSNCFIVGEETILADYILGQTRRSDFSAVVSSHDKANAIHLFFRADLTSKHQLSSFAKAPFTHWHHSFVRIPKERNLLEISYSSTTRQFVFVWRSI